MPISLPDARQLSDEVLQALRLRAIRGCELGYTETEVADLLGLARETVSRWWSAYAESGEEALPGDRTGRPVGSGRTLNDGQAAWLRTILVGQQPEDVGIPSPLWTREAVRALIKKEYGIDMPVRTVGAYLRRWGFTPKAPRRHPRAHAPQEARAGRAPRGTRPPRGSAAGSRRSPRRSSGGPPARGPRSSGVTRPGRRPTTC